MTPPSPEQLQARIRELEMLNELGRLVATAHDFDALFSSAAQILETRFDFDRLSISFYDPETDQLRTFALRTTITGTHTPPGTMSRLPSQLRPLVEEQRGLLFPNLELMTDDPLVAQMVAEGLKSTISVPLLHAGALRGILAMHARTKAAYAEEDLHLLQQVALQIAPAVENVRLFRDLQKNRSQRKVHEARLRFQAQLLDSVRESVVATDLDGTITYWGKGAERLYGYVAAEVLGKSIADFIVTAANAPAEATRMAQVRTDGFWHGEYRQQRRDGTTFWGEAFISLVHDEAGEPIGFVGIDHDVTDRRALQSAAATISSTLDLGRVLALILDEIGQILSYDSATIFLLEEDEAVIVATRGLPEDVVGQRFAVASDHFFHQMRERGQPVLLEDTWTNPNFKGWAGTSAVRAWLAVPLISPDGFTGFLTLDSLRPGTYTIADARMVLSFAQQAAMAVENARLHESLHTHLTKLEMTQARLLQSEKLAAIGELVAGVAHELNNPLAAILLYADLLKRSELAQQARDRLDRIEEQAGRARDIVQALLDFARQRTPRYQSVQVNDLLQSSLALLAYRLQSHDIAVELDLDPDLPPIPADPGQLQQVFVNILNNAYQSLQDAGQEGQLLLRTQRTPSRFLPARDKPVEMIRVTIHNNGPSISPEDLPHIFDPFFTTKEPGEGTGLGLAVSHGIIQEHAGHIWAKSRQGQGATFFVELPLRID